MSETYPTDDFDQLPQGGPVGVHRRQRSPWAPVLPFLIVLLVVPLLAWGVATLIQRNVPEEEVVEVLSQSEQVVQSGGETTEVEEQVEVVIPESDVPTAAPDDPSAEQTPSPTTPTETGAVHYDAGVQVLNGTGIAGHAAGVADAVVAAGFANASAANADGWLADENTVFYSDASMLSTAQAVAAAAGISAIVENADVAPPGSLVVFLAQ